jgi:succinate-semialdehyde dehydrogenase/glutarate-semialdehyde dehydrogenase
MGETATREAELLAKVPTGLLINGEWRDAAGGQTLDVEDPATGKVLLTIANAQPEDGAAALDAAAAAQADWAKTSPRERGEILRRAFELVTERTEDFALLMTMEMGKPLAEARGEVTYGAEFLRWFSEGRARQRPLRDRPGRQEPPARPEEVGGPLPADHPVELPAGHGNPQDRTRDRRRLHGHP